MIPRSVICATLLCGLLPAAQLVASGPRSPHVSVREAEGRYTVVARFDVPQPPAVAFAVLTDYEQIPRFMRDVTLSVVRERAEEHAIVEQEAVATMMMFSRRVYLMLEVCEGPNTIRFRDASRRTFSHYEGGWRVESQDGVTVVHYELSAQPSFAIPTFVLTRLLKRDARQMIARLQAEIAARALTPAPAR